MSDDPQQPDGEGWSLDCVCDAPARKVRIEFRRHDGTGFDRVTDLDGLRRFVYEELPSLTKRDELSASMREFMEAGDRVLVQGVEMKMTAASN